MTKKRAKKIYEGKPKKNKSYLFPILGVIVVVLAIGFASSWNFWIPQPETTTLNTTLNMTELVKVNGEPIHQYELDKQWNAIPSTSRVQMTRYGLLDEMIKEKLLLQQAAKLKIKVSDDDVDAFISTQLGQTGMTKESFESILKGQGTTMQDMRTIYKKQLTIAKLFETEIKDDISPTKEEVNNYYEEHKQEFFKPQQVTVRHILINLENGTEERVALVEGLLDKGEDFCDLVKNYSSDFGSTDKCGEYTFGKGVMVKEFEDAAFDMEIGEIRTVKSQFGYHIMKKIADIPAGTMKLNETIQGVSGQPTVEELISKILTEQKAKVIFDDYVGKIEEKSTIEYLNAKMPEKVDEDIKLINNLDIEQANTTNTDIEVRKINTSASLLNFTAYALGKIKTHHGTFTDWKGTLTFDGEEIVAAQGTIQANSVQTDSEKLDTHLKSDDFFDVEVYPEIILKSTKILYGEEETTLVADLTFRGITNQISFPVDIERNSITGMFEIDTEAYNMSYTGVNPTVELSFTMVAE